jgi:hypothetical protein
MSTHKHPHEKEDSCEINMRIASGQLKLYGKVTTNLETVLAEYVVQHVSS